MTENATIMNQDQIAEAINNAFPQGIASIEVAPKRIFLTVSKDILLDLCKKMKDELGFEHVSCVTGVDLKDKFQVVYHISSYHNKVVAEITADIPNRDKPEIDSITPLWGGANWHEREAYDMFGIVFVGHPKMERLLMPEDFTFFPLRKDFIPGRRVS
ncbi:MAG TPA: NADH-quinone oxidoreductase subunit C [Methanomassiliicoccales archaeon]|nr:NADH-quinone oxidoreductase subunit C [Methanomassiliicoccales archaeon]